MTNYDPPKAWEVLGGDFGRFLKKKKIGLTPKGGPFDFRITGNHGFHGIVKKMKVGLGNEKGNGNKNRIARKLLGWVMVRFGVPDPPYRGSENTYP